MHRAWRIARNWLYVVHRWIGIATCILFAMWFVSGVVMMYVPYPSLTQRERLAGLEPIDWAQVALAPDAALAEAGPSGYPQRLRLEMMAGEPVYRIAEGRRRWTVSAADGRLVDEVDAASATAIARRFAGLAEVRAAETIERDQWTVAGNFDFHRPLHRIAFADPAGTVLYVSSVSGEVVQDTRRRERFWNWLGSVPHWIYLTDIRTDAVLWRQVILWTSGVGLVGGVAGAWIGLLRVRVRRRYEGGRVTPYRGWMKWHHLGGLVAGATLLTWTFSGWLSVNPFDWLVGPGPDRDGLIAYAGHDQPSFPADLPRLASAAEGATEARFVWAAGKALVVASEAGGQRRILDARTAGPPALTDELLYERARRLSPRADLIEAERLTKQDVYWYGHHNPVVLPALRVRFDDPESSWFHIDPQTGEVVGYSSRTDRTGRWLFNFLHDFDLPVLLRHRPVRDGLMWALSAGGLVIAISGMVIGWRRLKHKVRAIRRRARAARRGRKPAEGQVG